jgi:hypothetical protein
VRARYQNEEFRPEEIKLEGDEWYVPLSQNLHERPELTTAAHILRAILTSHSAWRFDIVLGALFREDDSRLFLPLPAWKDVADSNVLNSMTRLVTRVAPSRGLVKDLVLLPIGANGEPVDLDRKRRLQDAYRHVARLPSDANVDLVDLASI